tara:strand:+ start:784 stop:1110 length:327 start_codon:yes stop_codon:yes gene_type:complete
MRKTVKAMAAYGIRHDDIARVVGVTGKTLRKHYRGELDTGHIEANAQVAGSLFQNAKGGNVTAQIWWTKTRMGWSEKRDDDDGAAKDKAREVRDAVDEMRKRTRVNSD